MYECMYMPVCGCMDIKYGPIKLTKSHCNKKLVFQHGDVLSVLTIIIFLHSFGNMVMI